MSNYSKITDFAAKDSLSTGNPAKIVKGVEIDDELVAISGAIASKANTAGPSLTGTTTVVDLTASGALTVSGAVTVSGATSLQAVTATSVVADTLTLDSAIVFEGATEDAYETTITFTDPTADRTITFPNASGTVAFTSDIASQATLEGAKTGTYSVSGTDVTVNITAHGYDVGDLLAIDFTSGNGVDGRYTVVTKTDNTFTVTHGTSISTSGNISVQLYTVGTMVFATSAEVLAGTVTNTVVTPYTYVQNKLLTSTAQATTSGTTLDFTTLPSWVKRITVMLIDVSTNGSSSPIIQLGTSSGIVTSGYVSSVSGGSSGMASATSSSGFILQNGNYGASNTVTGSLVISYFGSNKWVAHGVFSNATGSTSTQMCAGSKALSGTLDRIRLTAENGTDTFDAGSINILYE
jgi:hypothetical protein